mmetsp:Transcript_8209/g.19250  ORF Transcript_8209/g.19250 Transcript_8209/m.19250 type:complete len:209 (-) Transcript_8209:474-1100(-)
MFTAPSSSMCASSASRSTCSASPCASITRPASTWRVIAPRSYTCQVWTSTTGSRMMQRVMKHINSRGGTDCTGTCPPSGPGPAPPTPACPARCTAHASEPANHEGNVLRPRVRARRRRGELLRVRRLQKGAKVRVSVPTASGKAAGLRTRRPLLLRRLRGRDLLWESPRLLVRQQVAGAERGTKGLKGRGRRRAIPARLHPELEGLAV